MKCPVDCCVELVVVRVVVGADIQRLRKAGWGDMLESCGSSLLLLSLPLGSRKILTSPACLSLGCLSFSRPLNICVSDYLSLDMYLFLFS